MRVRAHVCARVCVRVKPSQIQNLSAEIGHS